MTHQFAFLGSLAVVDDTFDLGRNWTASVPSFEKIRYTFEVFVTVGVGAAVGGY